MGSRIDCSSRRWPGECWRATFCSGRAPQRKTSTRTGSASGSRGSRPLRRSGTDSVLVWPRGPYSGQQLPSREAFASARAVKSPAKSCCVGAGLAVASAVPFVIVHRRKLCSQAVSIIIGGGLVATEQACLSLKKLITGNTNL